MTDQASADADQADRELMARIAKDRDVAAMEALYRQYRPRLMGFLRRMSNDTGLLEEAYNEVMIKIWEKAHQYQGRSKVSSWVFSIAHRTCLRMVVKQQKRDQVFEMTGDELPDQVEEVEEPEFDSAQMNAAVRKLPAKQRVVIELCYFEGYSTEEIGQIVNCPTNTVKTRLHHARKKIKEFLERQEVALATGERSF